MKIHDIAILFFIFWGSISQCAAQKIAVKTNLLYGTYASSPNLETEFGIPTIYLNVPKIKVFKFLE